MQRIAFSYNILKSNKRLHTVEFIPADTNYSSFQKVIKVPNNVVDTDSYNNFLLSEIIASAPQDLWLLESIADTEMTEAPSNIITTGIVTQDNITPSRPTGGVNFRNTRAVVFKDI